MSDTGIEYGENHYVVSAARMNAIMQSIIIFTVRTHGRLSRKLLSTVHRLTVLVVSVSITLTEIASWAAARPADS